MGSVRRGKAARRRRVLILSRWMALIDEVTRLEDAVRAECHSTTFTHSERQRFYSALDQLWTALEWHRPAFPPPPLRNH